MMILAATRGTPFALAFIIGFLLCCLVGLIGFAKAYSNLQPGINWLNFMFIPIQEKRKHPERIFSPKGLFWLKVAKYAVIAGFALMVATELLR
jgi:hypothetical protein